MFQLRTEAEYLETFRSSEIFTEDEKRIYSKAIVHARHMAVAVCKDMIHEFMLNYLEDIKKEKFTQLDMDIVDKSISSINQD